MDGFQDPELGHTARLLPGARSACGKLFADVSAFSSGIGRYLRKLVQDGNLEFTSTVSELQNGMVYGRRVRAVGKQSELSRKLLRSRLNVILSAGECECMLQCE